MINYKFLVDNTATGIRNVPYKPYPNGIKSDIAQVSQIRRIIIISKCNRR